MLHFMAGTRDFSFLEKHPGQLWGSTQPSIQWVPWALSPEVIVHGHEVDHSLPLLVWLRISGALLQSLICLNGMRRGNFTFHFLLLLLNVDILKYVWILI
jgi:hypothetical protein